MGYGAGGSLTIDKSLLYDHEVTLVSHSFTRSVFVQKNSLWGILRNLTGHSLLQGVYCLVFPASGYVFLEACFSLGTSSITNIIAVNKRMHIPNPAS